MSHLKYFCISIKAYYTWKFAFIKFLKFSVLFCYSVQYFGPFQEYKSRKNGFKRNMRNIATPTQCIHLRFAYFLILYLCKIVNYKSFCRFHFTKIYLEYWKPQKMYYFYFILFNDTFWFLVFQLAERSCDCFGLT